MPADTCASRIFGNQRFGPCGSIEPGQSGCTRSYGIELCGNRICGGEPIGLECVVPSKLFDPALCSDTMHLESTKFDCLYKPEELLLLVSGEEIRRKDQAGRHASGYWDAFQGGVCGTASPSARGSDAP